MYFHKPVLYKRNLSSLVSVCLIYDFQTVQVWFYSNLMKLCVKPLFQFTHFNRNHLQKLLQILPRTKNIGVVHKQNKLQSP